MFRGKNPNRVHVEQSTHDRCVQAVADSLAADGYHVLADHIHWEPGAPHEVSHCVPDILAKKDDQTTVFEVETCSTIGDIHTREQLAAFSLTYPTVLVIPQDCLSRFLEGGPVEHARNHLKSWGLHKVTLATFDLRSQKLQIHR
ncbi:hypothetical protein GTO91_11990 [Heliobacterium undosum]|uniref:Uncharacterized protein n=1 Tax=Heliomicrobium undosum TaxID=121734 RepID=A0A845L2F0_9FIRM|nr:hypothetical protein [Heliomicrobium undosum]MZP30433.1 hypothetical protein [Heliomicrobium undosum]